MGKALQRRNLLLAVRMKLKLQARKNNAPARGVEKSLQEANKVVLDSVLAKITATKA